MSDREESPERQENGSNHSNDERQRDSGSPRRSLSRSRSRRRHHSRSKSRSHSRSRRYSKHRRSRSRSHSPKYSRRHSASRSPRDKRSPYEGGSYKGDRESRGGGRDGTKYRDNYRRSHSRSPMSSRRRHQGSRENPPAGRCLGIFGLSIYTQERDLHDVLSKYGPIDDVQIVYDAQTGRSRGFCFVYFKNSDDAKMAKERCNGIEIDGRKIRVDYSITQRAHTPTPGIYMGKPTYPRYRGSRGGGGGGGGGGDYYSGGGGGGGRDGYRERSPSPYYRDRRRYSRSRSRSYSPRKYSHYY